MKTELLVAAMTVGMTLATAAQARDDRPDAGLRGATIPTFEQLDANADGAVTPAEMDAAMQTRPAAQFTVTDTNGDGLLQAAELPAHREGGRRAGPARMFERTDANAEPEDGAPSVAATLQTNARARPANRPCGLARASGPKPWPCATSKNWPIGKLPA